MDKTLEVKNLTKIFSVGSIFSRTKIIAVDNVSFHIRPAEIFALAGESGCGKTTTAKMILGFEEPTSGEILFKGKPIWTWRRKPRHYMKDVQAVFQNPFETFNPLKTVDEFFYETVRNYKIARRKNDIEEMIRAKLEAVGLSFKEIRGRYPNELSGGQLQRASIARALLTNPCLLVADEPVSMVDASLRMSIVNLFKKLKDEFGLSVLYITHDLATAYYVSDRIAIMFRGNIIEMGPVDLVLTKPRHPYTRLLRESVPEPDPQKKWLQKITVATTEHEEYLRRGCKFGGRCPMATNRCKTEVPKECFLEDGVMVKCHLYEQKDVMQAEIIGSEQKGKKG